MRKLVICAIFDRALQAYMQPFFVPSVGMAVRSFRDEVNRKESPMYAHPDDYDLSVLGTFDEDSGDLSRGPEVKVLMRGKDAKE